MEPRGDVLTHDEIWDDSALIDSWNQALEEYKKYHSIHAKGGSVDEILGQAETRRDAKPETTDGSQPMEEEEGEAMEEGEVDIGAQTDETKANGQGTDGQGTDAQQFPPSQGPVRGGPRAVQAAANAGPSNLGPQTLLGSVQDEGLRKLLMSWYYAGYYTGLYEGQQGQQSQQGQQGQQGQQAKE